MEKYFTKSSINQVSSSFTSIKLKSTEMIVKKFTKQKCLTKIIWVLVLHSNHIKKYQEEIVVNE